MFLDKIIPVKDLARIVGHPMMDSLDGEVRSSLQTLTHPAMTDAERVVFGVYMVDTTPPVGQRWTGAFAEVSGVPVAVFEPVPAPTIEELHEAINVERLRRIDVGSGFAVAGIEGLIQLRGRPFDQTVYLALLTRASGYKAAGVTDPILTLRSADDVNYSLTPDQMISLVAQSMTWFESVMAVSWAMKDGTGAFPNGIPADFTNDTYWP